MKNLTLLFLLIISFVSHAQEDYKKLAQQTCDCVSKKDLTNATKKSIEMSLGLCLLEVIQQNNIDIQITDAPAMRSFGEKVGIQMAPICPSVFSILAEEESTTKIQTMTAIGKIKSIDDKNFLFVTLKEKEGKEIQFVWLRYFNGSDEFVSDPKKLVGKQVTIEYQNTECYLPKAKGYFAQKEIVGLVVN